VVMPVSSTKTSSVGSICRIRSQKTVRSSWMSARSCSLARNVFFYATAQTAAGRGTASAGLLAVARCAPPTALCIRPACDRSAHSPAPARSPRPPHRSPACDHRRAAWHSVGPRRAPAGARGTPSRDRRQRAGRRLPATDQLPQPATPARAGRPNRAWASSPPLVRNAPFLPTSKMLSKLKRKPLTWASLRQGHDYRLMMAFPADISEQCPGLSPSLS